MQGQGLSIRKIAIELGRSPSTISKELKRTNAIYYRGIYISSQTHIRVHKTWRASHKRINEIGHFEIDSVESSKKHGKSRSCLTVMVDRRTRKTIIRKTASKTAKLTTTSIINALKSYRNTIKSITYDNGHEFSKYEIINKTLNTKSYFCKPYHSREKGTVENIN